MKTQYLLLLFLISLFLTSSSCKDDPIHPIDLLPPLTTTGENTFGCLINGEAFLPDSKSRHDLGSFYLFIPGQGNNFGISASNKISPDRIDNLNIYADSLDLIEGGNYSFAQYIELTDIPGRFVGYVAHHSLQSTERIGSIEMSGEIEFIRFSELSQIASGIFWFDCVDEEGDTLKIREGRFDVQF